MLKEMVNIEKIGTYNPNTNPATIELNLDSAVNGCTMVHNQLILLKLFFLTKELY
jgi:hypothetical protein